MSFLRHSRSPRRPGKGRATPEEARRDLIAALERARARAAGDPRPQRVRLLAQVTTARDYERIRGYWIERAPEDVRLWPARLPADEFALNLWPVAPSLKRADKPGRVKPLTVPGFATFQITYDIDTAFAVVAAVWLDTAGAERMPMIELTTPIIERWVQGRVAERRELSWPD